MIGEIEAENTPLQKRLVVFGNQIAQWVLILAIALVVGGLFVEGLSRLGNILLFAVALAAETLIVLMGVAGSFLVGLYDVTGELLLPLTAAQLLWVNVITDGPPALALGLDRDPGVLRRPPRDPKLPLLDRVSLRFVLIAGLFKALVGVALLIALPRYGYTYAATRSVLFLYMSIGQLVFAYPARHIAGHPRTNITLHFALLLGIVVQLLTVIVPQLRQLLGLELPGFDGFVWVAGAVLLSWGLAELIHVWLVSRSNRFTSPGHAAQCRQHRLVLLPRHPRSM